MKTQHFLLPAALCMTHLSPGSCFPSAQLISASLKTGLYDRKETLLPFLLHPPFAAKDPLKYIHLHVQPLEGALEGIQAGEGENNCSGGPVLGSTHAGGWQLASGFTVGAAMLWASTWPSLAVGHLSLFSASTGFQ